MPKAMEDALRKEAAKKGFGKERADRYVYGAMRNAGWRPGQGMVGQAARNMRKKPNAL